MELRQLYIIFQVIGIIIMLAELIYVVFQKPSKLQTDLVLMLLMLIFAFAAYIVELSATTLEGAIVGCILGYIGKPFAMLTTMFLLLNYSHIEINKYIRLGIIFYFIILTTFVFTSTFHNLYYSSLELDMSRLGSPLKVGHGPVWYIYMISTFALFGAYTAIIVYEFRHSKTKQAKQMAMFLFLMMFFSILGLACFIAGITKGYDSTLAGTLLGSLSLFVLLAKYHLFDSLNIGKDYTLNNSNDGIIVLDAKESISYTNELANKFIALPKGLRSRRKEQETLKILDTYEEGKPIFVDNKVYLLVKTNICAKRSDIIIGKTYIFDDITEQYDYQERLKGDVDKATEKIKDIQRSVLISFANLIEARDGYTGAHIKNVGHYAREIALELEREGKYQSLLNEEKIKIIEDCSALHDVGKIKIPDNILGKPGKLTSEEFDEMKKHTTHGEEVIANTIQGVEEPEYVEMARDIALYHHERWDGTGYPVGLKGTDIPLSARIIAVADVYDALRMKRPYKEPFPKDVAINIIKEESGTHFDPEIVDAFLKVVDNL